MLVEEFDEALAALRVGVAAVHEAVYEGALGNAVFLSDFHEFEQVVERRVHAARGGEAHEVQVLAVLLGVAVSTYDFGIFENAAVLAGAVDLYKVLVDDASCADVEVTHFGVTHLSVGQTNVLARGEELGVRIIGVQ